MLVRIQPRQPFSIYKPLGGEIESRLAYTQQSEGQNLPERPFFRVDYWSSGFLDGWNPRRGVCFH